MNLHDFLHLLSTPLASLSAILTIILIFCHEDGTLHFMNAGFHVGKMSENRGKWKQNGGMWKKEGVSWVK